MRAMLSRASALDWIRIGLLVAGVLFVLTGALPADEAEAGMRRIAPLLLFLGSVIVLATLARQAQVFDVIATWLARLGRGHYPALFALCVAFATVTTVVLNLDTTAVLLTPVFLALAPRSGIDALALAMTTIWLSNTASLLLPVSNLTNLLAADRVALSASEFAGRMWAPQLASVLATTALLWLFYWRRGVRSAPSYQPPEVLRPDHPGLCVTAGIACLLFVAAIPLVGTAIGWAALAAAAVVVVAFAVVDRGKLTWGLIPWQLLVLVTGLFLVVPTLSRFGLAEVMTAVVGSENGVVGAFRAAFAGAGLSNVVNNLPAYTAGEAVIAPGQTDQLLALLIGTNVGPVITPWASLATLLCLESCRRHGLTVSMRRFVLTGTALAAVALTASVAALLLTA